jgi:hypothetical protein
MPTPLTRRSISQSLGVRALGITALLLVSVYVASGYWIHHLSASQQLSPTHDEVADNACEFFRLARDAGDPEQAAMLFEVALSHVSKHTAAAPEAWRTLLSQAPQGEKINDREALSRFLGQAIPFEDAVSEGLRSSGSPDAFEIAWRLRTRITEDLQGFRESLAKLVEADLRDCYAKAEKSGSVAETLMVALPSLTPGLTALIATSSAVGEDPALAKLADVAARMQQLVLARSTLLGQQASRLRASVVTDEGGSASDMLLSPERNTVGLCQKLIDESTQLAEMIAGTDTFRLLEALPRAPSPSATKPPNAAAIPTASASDELMSATSSASATQVLAYNIWSLGQIQQAEEAVAWENLLSQIDQGFLDPAVSAVFSMVYNERLSQVKDPIRRGQIARLMLTETPMPLKAF